jgi:protein transport protein HofB
MDKRLQTPGISTLTPPVEASASIVEQVNSLLEQALRQRASDIHIEPGDDRLRIRLRVDGVLHSLAPLAPELAAPITARLKVLSNLDIAEHRVPQDGQFTLTLADRPISFRIATLPCRGGENRPALITPGRTSAGPRSAGAIVSAACRLSLGA